MGSKLTITIFSIITVLLLIIIIATGLFTFWIFIGIVILGTMYLFGYFYVLNHFKLMEEIDRKETVNKKKLDWCWDRANVILKKMVGGQGLSWAKGVGRKSEYRTFHNGIQLCGFRSMEGYLAGTQQLVVIIFDIENDDIVRYHADPTPNVIDDHFYEFKPFQSKESFVGRNMSMPYRSKYNQYNRRQPFTLHRQNSDHDNYDDMSSKPEPSEDLVNDSLKKIRN